MDKDSQADALTCYMREISKIKPLTRHEERELGHQIAVGNTVALQKLVKKNSWNKKALEDDQKFISDQEKINQSETQINQ